jgi:hypothetical protein
MLPIRRSQSVTPQVNQGILSRHFVPAEASAFYVLPFVLYRLMRDTRSHVIATAVCSGSWAPSPMFSVAPAATMTTQAPTPVVIVEEPPNLDAWDLTVSILVGVISLVLTAWAVRIGQQANRAAAKAAEEAERARGYSAPGGPSCAATDRPEADLPRCAPPRPMLPRVGMTCRCRPSASREDRGDRLLAPGPRPARRGSSGRSSSRRRIPPAPSSGRNRPIRSARAATTPISMLSQIGMSCLPGRPAVRARR